MISQIVVLVLVFLAVLFCAFFFIPVFFSGRKTTETNPEDEHEVIDDPIRRFIDPDDLQKMRYTACMITLTASMALVIVSGFYWGFIAVALLSAAAYQLPMWIIQRKIRKRNEEFETGMLDFTILIANTLRAGIALPSAIEMAIQTVGGAIREEFSVVLREHRLGVDLTESIERLSKRIESENLQLFSATVCVNMRTGGSMADVLDHVIETIRQRSAFYDKLKTMIAQSQFEALLMSLSPLAAFTLLWLLDRELMEPLVTTKIGWIAVFGITIWETIGYFVMKKVTEVKF